MAREGNRNDVSNEAITAAIYGKIGDLQQILETGYNVNTRDRTGKNLLHYAAGKGHPKVVELLLNHGIDVNNAENTLRSMPLHFAARKGNVKVLELIIKSGKAKLDRKNYKGFTALHVASCWGHIHIIKLLLEHHASVDVEDNKGHTALHAAAYNSKTNAVGTLLAAFADVTKVDENGCKPIDVVGSLTSHIEMHTRCETTESKCSHCYETYQLLFLYEKLLKDVTIKSVCSALQDDQRSAMHFRANLGISPCEVVHEIQQRDEITVSYVTKLMKRAGHHEICRRMIKTHENCICDILDSIQMGLSGEEVIERLKQQWQPLGNNIENGNHIQNLPASNFTMVIAFQAADKSEVIVPEYDIETNGDCERLKQPVALGRYKKMGEAKDTQITGMIQPLLLAEGLMGSYAHNQDNSHTNKQPEYITSKPTQKQLWSLSQELGHSWKDLAVHLDVPYFQLDQYERDHPNNSRQQNMAMLMDWRVQVQNNTHQERCRTLNEALKQIGKCDLYL